MKPIIAVTLDYPKEDTYAKTPWYAIREEYIKAVSDSGAIPFLLHYEFDDIASVLSTIDGLLLTGGAVDIDPAVYGVEEINPNVSINRRRSEFEMKVFQAAANQNMPILGICAGEQLMNVACGGSLIQHIPDEIDDAIEHYFNKDRHLPRHNVRLEKGSLLHEIVGDLEYSVNSTHHQSVKALGKGLKASAYSEDGVIEAIEKTDSDTFCLGVQWHPEYYHVEQDKKLMRYFVSECQKHKKKKQ